MKLWDWLASGYEPRDFKGKDDLQSEIASLKKQIAELEREVCHWKHLALTFKKLN